MRVRVSVTKAVRRSVTTLGIEDNRNILVWDLGDGGRLYYTAVPSVDAGVLAVHAGEPRRVHGEPEDPVVRKDVDAARLWFQQEGCISITVTHINPPGGHCQYHSVDDLFTRGCSGGI